MKNLRKTYFHKKYFFTVFELYLTYDIPNSFLQFLLMLEKEFAHFLQLNFDGNCCLDKNIKVLMLEVIQNLRFPDFTVF